MSEQSKFKRNIAYKFRIGGLLIGKPIIDGERFSFLELGNKKIVRVNIIGNITEKYESEGERKYTFFDDYVQIKVRLTAQKNLKFLNFIENIPIVDGRNKIKGVTIDLEERKCSRGNFKVFNSQGAGIKVEFDKKYTMLAQKNGMLASYKILQIDHVEVSIKKSFKAGKSYTFSYKITPFDNKTEK